ncbi:MAG: hypothetical protein HUU10_04555 [Bacteroidetes bacterium]|nr:hypothetical protein [Bacteroidota bacterium]
MPVTRFIPFMDMKPVFFLQADRGIREVHTDELPKLSETDQIDITENLWRTGSENVYLSSNLLRGKKSFLVESEFTDLLSQNGANGSFHENITGWQCKSSGGGVLSGRLFHETNPAHIQKGAGSLRHTDAANTDNTIEPTNTIALGAGTHTFSVFVKTANTQTIADLIRIIKVSDSSVLVTSGSVETNNVFQQITVTFFTASPVTVTPKIKTGTANQNMWIDSAIFCQLTFAPTFLRTNRTKPNFTFLVEDILDQPSFSVVTWFNIRAFDNTDSTFHIVWEGTDAGSPESYIRLGYNGQTGKIRIEMQNELSEQFQLEGTHPAIDTGKFYGLAFQYYRTSGRFLWVLTEDSTQQVKMSNNVQTSLTIPPSLSVANLSLGHKYMANDKQSLYINGVTIISETVSESELREFLLSTDYPYSVQESIYYAVAKEHYRTAEATRKVAEFGIFNDSHLKVLLKERGQFPLILPWAETLMTAINYYGYDDLPGEKPDANQYRAMVWKDIVRDYGTITGIENTIKLLTNDEDATVSYSPSRYFVNELYPPSDPIYMSEDYTFTATYTNNTEAGGRFIPDDQILAFINKYVCPVYLTLSKAP